MSFFKNHKYLSLWKREENSVYLDRQAAGIYKLQDIPMRWIKIREGECLRHRVPTHALH